MTDNNDEKKRGRETAEERAKRIERERQLPVPPMPRDVSDWVDHRKKKLTIIDRVAIAHFALWNSNNTKYRGYLEAVFDSQAKEGQLALDDFRATDMIKDHTTDAEIKSQNGATLIHALRMVLKRYHQDRKYRRQSVNVDIPNVDDDVEDGSNE